MTATPFNYVDRIYVAAILAALAMLGVVMVVDFWRAKK